MTDKRTRGLMSSATAFGAVAVMLAVAGNAGVTGALPLGLVLIGGVAITLVVLGVMLMRIIGRSVPNEFATRLVMETMGMLAVAAPVCLILGLAMGWVK